MRYDIFLKRVAISVRIILNRPNKRIWRAMITRSPPRWHNCELIQFKQQARASIAMRKLSDLYQVLTFPLRKIFRKIDLNIFSLIYCNQFHKIIFLIF